MMAKYLVVANQTVGGERLSEQIKSRMGADPASVYVLVPASGSDKFDAPTFDQVVVGSVRGPDQPGSSQSEESAWALARDHLAHQIAHLRQLGIQVDGEVGDPNPLKAIQEVLERDRFDEIILCTLPQPISRWLAMDLPRRMQRAFNLPVISCTDEVPQ